jgi:hypothetical protein
MNAPQPRSDADRAHSDAGRRHEDAARAHADADRSAAEAPTQTHPTPCPALDEFRAAYGGFRQFLGACALVLIGLLCGMNAVVWSQFHEVGQTVTAAQVDLTELRTKTDERFGAFKAEVIENQGKILAAIAALPGKP